MLAACGGGGESISLPPSPAEKATVPAPVKKATPVTGGNAVVIHMYQALYGMAPSHALLIDYSFQANTDASLFAKNLTDRFATASHADLAKAVLDNLGVTATTVPAITAKGESEYALLLDAVKQLFAAYPTMRGQVILNMTNLLVGLESDATYGTAATAYNSRTDTNFSNTATYSVPTDLAKVAYPDSYQTTTNSISDVNTDPCKLDSTVITYPQSWTGNYALPKVTGAPLSSTFKRGMYMKDIMLTDNPTFNSGCSGSLKSEFDRTITRLKALNVEYVYVPQWHWIGVKTDGSWYIMRAEESSGSLSDSDLSHFAASAHAAGLKVMMMNQIQGLMQSNGNAILPEANPANYRKWFDAYQGYILERAPYFSSLGIDVWELGCNGCIFMDQGTGSDADQSFFAAEYQKLLPLMKQNFKGQLLFGAGGANWLSITPSVLDNIDVIATGVWDNNFKPSTSQPFTVSNYKASLNTNAMTFDRLGKTVLMSFGIQSRANWFTLPGYMEETGCVTSMGNLNTSSSSCIERDTAPDFSLQATYYEAVLEYISTLPFKGNAIVAPGDMWETDSMISNEVFPNIGATIRNKPAEGVVKLWYAK